MFRLGVLGGSFDPAHEAHLELARRARAQLRLDRVRFLPAHAPPHKKQRALAPARHRLRILELLLRGERDFEIDRRELDAGKSVYTVDSLRAISRENAGARLFLLLGEDSFRALDGWRESDAIAELCELVVAPRGELTAAGDRPESWRGCRVHWLEGFRVDLSSTRLRESLRDSGVAPGLPAELLSYIRAHGLYSSDRK